MGSSKFLLVTAALCLLGAGAMPGAGAGAGNAEGGLKPTAPVVDLSVHLEQSASLSPQHLSLNISWTPPTEGELPEGKDMPRGFTVNILLLNSTRADCTPNARFPTFYAVHLDSPETRTVLVPEELMPGALLIRPGCTYNVTVESEPYLGGQVPHQVYVVPRSPISNAVSVEDTEIDDPVDDGSSRILYGNKVPQGSDIYQAAVLENMRHAGIGSIINEKFVITAATTVTTSSGSAKSARNFRIGVGYVDLNVYNETITYSVARFYIHEEFNITTMQNNIALVRISDYFKYSGTVFPIKLGYSWHTQMDLRCTTLGYGQIWSTPVAPDMQSLYYGYMYVNPCGSVTPRPPAKTLCAISREYLFGLCEGDKGAPLVCMDYLVGVASHADCSGNGTAVYSSVPEFTNWIEEILEADAGPTIFASSFLTATLAVLALVLGSA